MAARSSGMPSTAVYLVWPSLMALIAASLMFCGVSKSGSPAASPITSRPAAFRSRALLVIAMVGDGWMRESDWARKSLGKGMDVTLFAKWREGDNNRRPAGQDAHTHARHSFLTDKRLLFGRFGEILVIQPRLPGRALCQAGRNGRIRP